MFKAVTDTMKFLGRKTPYYIVASLLSLTTYSQQAAACDACALYNASRISGHLTGSLSLSINEQYTSYRIAEENAYNTRSADLTRSYSTTQLNVGYDLSDNLGIQGTLPFVVRNFDEVTNYRADEESETGIGDGSIAINYSPVSIRETDQSVILSFVGGIKLPTGDSGSLSQDSQTETDHADRVIGPATVQHHQLSGIPGLSGRTLSIGTGSVDYILGSTLNTRWDRILMLGVAEYSIKSEGSFDYRFANELLWNVGPGAYLLLNDDYTIILRCVLSGEHTDRDTHKGNKVPDSAVRNLYLGPEFIVTLNNRITIELGIDIPFDTEPSAILPDYRLHSAVSYRF